MEFEDILQHVGGYGTFHRKWIIFFLLPMSLVVNSILVNLIFIMYTPEHWCSVPQLSTSNLSIEVRRSLMSPLDESSCRMYNVSYDSFLSTGHFAGSNATETMPCRDWEYDKTTYDSTAVTQWNLVCGNSHYPSMVLMLQKLGNMIGASFYGFISDKFGRRMWILALSLVIIVTELSCVLADNFIIFVMLRLINGTALGSAFSLPIVLTLELTPPEQRGRMNGIYNTGLSVGICIIPLVVYLARSWVILAYVNAAVGMLMLFYWWYLPESPCWLVSQGRHEESMKIMKRIGEVNGKSVDTDLLLKKVRILGDSIKKKKEEENMSIDWSLWKYPRLLRSFFILSFCWAAHNVGYFGPIYNVGSLNGNEFINFFLLSVVELPGNVIFWILMDRIGRRWTSSIGFFITGILYLLPILGFPYGDIISSMTGKLTMAGLCIIIDQQSTEIYPTVARSFGIGASKTLSNILTIFLPYIADLSSYGKSLPFVVISFTCILTAILSSFLPETLNQNLPQTLSDAEVFGKDQKYFSWSKPKSPVPDPSFS